MEGIGKDSTGTEAEGTDKVGVVSVGEVSLGSEDADKEFSGRVSTDLGDTDGESSEEDVGETGSGVEFAGKGFTGLDEADGEAVDVSDSEGAELRSVTEDLTKSDRAEEDSAGADGVDIEAVEEDVSIETDGADGGFIGREATRSASSAVDSVERISTERDGTADVELSGKDSTV